LFRRTTGYAIGYIFRVLARIRVNELSLNHKSLSDMWEIEVIVQIGANPDFAGLDSAMVRGALRMKLRFFLSWN
jgi:hypothetical protein